MRRPRSGQPESLALRRVLTTCNIGDDVRGRVEAALCAGPEAYNETTVDKTLGGDRLLGGFYPVISVASALGARLANSSRAGDECSPSTRLVDPRFIEVSGDAAYLVAWNVVKDAKRSYGLYRISNAELTDDSVTPSAATASIASRMPSSPTIPLSATISPRILPPKACAPMAQARPCAS